MELKGRIKSLSKLNFPMHSGTVLKSLILIASTREFAHVTPCQVCDDSSSRHTSCNSGHIARIIRKARTSSDTRPGGYPPHGNPRSRAHTMSFRHPARAAAYPQKSYLSTPASSNIRSSSKDVNSSTSRRRSICDFDRPSRSSLLGSDAGSIDTSRQDLLAIARAPRV